MNVGVELSSKTNLEAISDSSPFVKLLRVQVFQGGTVLELFRSFQSVLKWDPVFWQKWHEDNLTVSLWISAAYVILAHLGVHWRKDRPSLELQKPLVTWNLILSIFSIIGTYNILPEFLRMLTQHGFHAVACENFASEPHLVFWAWLFTWSKVFELGDTVFIILRKRKLLFLHWYHHAMTLISSFLYFPGMLAINPWAIAMNFAVHSVMYCYYSLQALGLKVPKPIALMITIIQITQMLIGFLVANYELAMLITGVPCKMTLGLSIYTSSVYLTYFILFLSFFFRTYFKSNNIFVSFSSSLQKVEKSL